MANEGVYYDQEMIGLLRKALDEAWDSLTPDLQQAVQKEDLAERILAAAAAGERDLRQLRRTTGRVSKAMSLRMAAHDKRVEAAEAKKAKRAARGEVEREIKRDAY